MSISSDLKMLRGRREHLLSRWQLALLALGILIALGLLAPTSSMLVGSLGHSDRLSLQYLRLLVAVRPHDGGLKLRLAQALYELGRYDEASRLLDSLSGTDPRLQPAIDRLGLLVRLAQVAQEPTRAAREPSLIPRTVKDIQALLGQSLSVSELEHLAADSLRIGHPELAGQIYLRLSVLDPTRRTKWLEAAAQQQLATGQPAAAGVLYDQLAEIAAGTPDGRRYALLALKALTGADMGDKALAFARRYLQRYPDDRELLEAAARLALASNQPLDASGYYDALVRLSKSREDKLRYAKAAVLSLSAADKADRALLTAGRYLRELPGDAELLAAATRLAVANRKPQMAQQWGRALLKSRPENSALLAHQIDLELASGNQLAALELAQRLLARRPGDHKQRERLVQLALWNNRSDLALAQLFYLAKHTLDRKYLEQALKMAPQLYELDMLADLLALKARRGRLTNTELAALVEAFENVGRPEELVEVLGDYLKRESDHREAWEALAEVHERRGDLDSALSTLERVNRSFGSSLREITHRAELLWQLHQPTRAYVLLRDALDRSGVAATRELLASAELNAKPQETQLALIAPRREHEAGAGRLGETGAGKSAPPADKGPEQGSEKEPAPEQKAPAAQEEEQKSFLKLLAELVWHSEPRPESLKEYRTLWQRGALLRESTERYIQLAEEQGLTDEALGVSVAAFHRFKDPEFLLGAMDIASKLRRQDDMDRLVELAHQHPELFAQSKRYYLTVAEYYLRRKDYDRAQQAYLRVIALDPSTVAARADLLWLLIDHSDDRQRLRGKRSRALLGRYLTDWRRLAEDEPALWLPFATGWAMLGHSKKAVAYYEREWTQRPSDHLWLLGYISTLDALSRSSDVLRLRRYALTQLRTDALRAAHPGATPAEREVLKAYAELVRDAYGPGKGSRWMAEVLRTDLEPEVQKGLLATWRSGPESAAPSYWVTDSNTLTVSNPWGRFPKSPKLGQQQKPDTLADASSAPDESEEPPPAPLRVLDQDVAAGEDQVPENAQIVSLAAGVQSVNDLLILNTSVSALVARGIWALGGRVGVNQLFLNGADDPQAGATEIELSAYGQWRHRLGRLEVGVGANLRSDANLWSGWASESFRLWNGGTLLLGLHLNEIATDTRWLRIYGARHRITASLNTSFAGDGFLNIQGNAYHYHSRENDEIGAGANADLELGYRIHRVRPLWTVRVSGSYTRNFLLTDRVPTYGAGSTSAAALIDALPIEFAAIGVGSRVEHRFPGVSPLGAGRFRYFADAWVGWLYPVNLVGFEMNAGVSLALPHKQEISLSGFLANNRWLGPGVVNAGISLRYLFR